MQTLQLLKKSFDLSNTPYSIDYRMHVVGNTLISSPYAIKVYWPKNTKKQLENLLGTAFKVIHWPEFECFCITPENKAMQYIANAIDSCMTFEQLESAERMVDNYNGPAHDLTYLLVMKAAEFA